MHSPDQIPNDIASSEEALKYHEWYVGPIALQPAVRRMVLILDLKC
jgi:hypothetical protein